MSGGVISPPGKEWTAYAPYTSRARTRSVKEGPVKSRDTDLVQVILQARQRMGVLLFTTPLPRKPPKRQVGRDLDLLPPPMPPSTVSLGNAELEGLLLHLLPHILTGMDLAISAFGQRKLSLLEALSFPTTVMAIVSLTVRQDAPHIRGRSAHALVGLIFRAVYDRYAVPLLPLWLRPFTALFRSSALAGLESHSRGVLQRRDT